MNSEKSVKEVNSRMNLPIGKVRLMRMGGAVLVLSLTGCGAAPTSAPKSSTPAASQSVAASTTSASPRTLTPVTVGVISKSLGGLLFYVGENLGIYKKYGIDLSVKVVGNPTALIGALQAGSITVAGDVPPVVESVERGFKSVKVIFVGPDRPEYMLIAAKGFTKISQLQGKVIAGSSSTQLPGEIGQELLASNGLKPGSYKVAVVQNDTDRAALLASSKAQAAIVGIGEGIPLLDRGYHLLASTMTNVSTSDPGNGIGVTTEEIQKEPGLMRRLVEASLAAVKITATDSGQTIPVIEKNFGLNATDAKEAFNLLKPTYSLTGKPSAAAVTNELTLDAHSLHLAHPIAQSQAYDFAFLPGNG